jgi:endonuclease YncB( thermonuclease family)
LRPLLVTFDHRHAAALDPAAASATAPSRQPAAQIPERALSHYPYQRHARPSTLGRIYSRRLPASQPIYTVDGDTLRVGPDRIRLRGINTPELNEPGGDAARERLAQLLQQGPIRIVPYGQDIYGRTIADVFVDGRNVAEVLRQEGYAKVGS